jgi:hypothetical protein
MAKIRLYIYSSHDGGATFVYDTGVFDSSAPPGAGCLNPDARQFANLQDLLSYAAGRGETVQQVNSVQEVNAICSGGSPSGSVVQSPSATSGLGTCSAGICGPTSPTTVVPTGSPGPTGVSTVTQGGSTPIYVGPANPISQPAGTGSSPNPFTGGLPGQNILGTANPASAPNPLAGGTSSGTTTAAAGGGFDLLAFLKGPYGILAIVLLLIVLLLAGKKGG